MSDNFILLADNLFDRYITIADVNEDINYPASNLATLSRSQSWESSPTPRIDVELTGEPYTHFSIIDHNLSSKANGSGVSLLVEGYQDGFGLGTRQFRVSMYLGTMSTPFLDALLGPNGSPSTNEGYNGVLKNDYLLPPLILELGGEFTAKYVTILLDNNVVNVKASRIYIGKAITSTKGVSYGFTISNVENFHGLKNSRGEAFYKTWPDPSFDLKKFSQPDSSKVNFSLDFLTANEQMLFLARRMLSGTRVPVILQLLPNGAGSENEYMTFYGGLSGERVLHNKAGNTQFAFTLDELY